MPQLVGQSCVHCRERIGSVLDGRFCPSCGCPVHAPCAATTAARRADGACPACGAPAAEVAPRQEAAAQQAAAQAGAGQGRGAGVMAVVCVGFILIGLMQFVLAGSRPPAADIHDERGNIGNALVPIGIGVVGLLLVIRQMLKRP